MLHLSSKALQKKGSLIPAPFFLMALIILLSSKWGPLTWPGVAAAAAGIVLAVLGQDELAAADGFLSAATSFTAQSLAGVCPSCMAAAVCFAVAGILVAVNLIQKRCLLTVLLALPLVFGLCFFSARLGGGEDRQFKPARIAVAQETVGLKNKLYYSPWCDYCEEPLAAIVKVDPDGRTWQPVVVPHSALSEGDKIVRDLGYRGRVISAPESPSGGLPCLELPDNSILTGKFKVLNYLERSGLSSQS